MKSALKIAGVYFLFSFLWITLSDRVLAHFVRSPEQLTELQTLKGLLFISLNTLLIFWMVRAHMKSLERRLEVERELSRTQTNIVRELDHRVRNNLAELGSLLGIYRRTSTSVPDLAERMQRRIGGFKAAHELVAVNQFAQVPLDQVIRVGLGDLGMARYESRQRSDLAVSIDSLQVSALVGALTEIGAHAFSAANAGGAEVSVQVEWDVITQTGQSTEWTRLRVAINSSIPDAHVGFMASRDSGSGRSLVEGLTRFNLSGEVDIRVDGRTLICQIQLPVQGLRTLAHPEVDIRPHSRGTAATQEPPSRISAAK